MQRGRRRKMRIFKDWIPFRRSGSDRKWEQDMIRAEERKQKAEKIDFLLDELKATNIRIGLLNSQFEATTTKEEERTLINVQIGLMVAYQNTLTARLRCYGRVEEEWGTN